MPLFQETHATVMTPLDCMLAPPASRWPYSCVDMQDIDGALDLELFELIIRWIAIESTSRSRTTVHVNAATDSGWHFVGHYLRSCA